jgi:hypothetical protein
MQRHLEPLVCILVVHVVDNVHRVHVDTREPLHHPLESFKHVIEIEVVTFDSAEGGRDLLAAISSRPPLMA